MISSWNPVTLWLVWCSLAVASDLAIFEPRDGVLVLRNGNVLSGHITPLGESYIVMMTSGAESRVPRADVDFDCRSLEEAYLIKRDSMASDDVKSHLHLAMWCLKHELLARAADQLLVVRMSAPDEPLLATLENRLKSRATVSSAESVQTPPSPGRSRGTSAELDVAPFLVQHFTTIIQPILFQRCANFACHGGGSSQYRLIRPRLGQAPTSHLTLRNLEATLTFIDRDRPQSSRLMAMAEQVHGRATTPNFHDKTGNQLALLWAWVRRLEKSPESSPELARVAASMSKSTVRTPHTTAEKREAFALDQMPVQLPVEYVRQTPERGETGTAAENDAPRDAFDPEVFNRRFHTGR
jgi:hypothetical protein